MKTRQLLLRLFARAFSSLAVVLLSAIDVQLSTAFAQGTAFTYQGRLDEGTSSANGSYDLRFSLFSASSGGSAIAGPVIHSGVSVSNGLFTVMLDFGNQFSGADRWLEIGVRANGSGAFSDLSPRQKITSAPYAVQAATAGTALDVTSGVVVKSLNGLRDNVTLASGSNVTITPTGNTLTIASSGAGGSGVWSLNGANAYYNSGNVGIGTATPGRKLTVATLASQYGLEHTDGNVRLGTYLGGSTGGGWLGTISNHKLSFFVNDGGASMSVETNGSVGIGTVSVAANETLSIQARAGDLFPFYIRDSGGLDVFRIHFAASPPTLQMFGNASKNAGGTSWSTISDRRVKQDVRDYEPGLNEILKLRPVRFRYRDDVRRGLCSAQEEFGFIAQEVREVIPDAVTEGQDGYLSLKADPIHWAAINAIKELNAKVEAKRQKSEKRIQTLEEDLKLSLAENGALKQRLDRLEKILEKSQQTE